MSIVAKSMKAFVPLRMDASMFKDVEPWRSLWSMEAEKVANLANLRVAKVDGYAEDPAAGAWAKWGFAPIASALPFYESHLIELWEEDEEGQTLFEDFQAYADQKVFVTLDNNQILFIIEKRERVLPGDTIREAVDKECHALEERQGDPVNRKQRMEIKDVVVARLLATAAIRIRRIPVIIQESSVDPEFYDCLVFNSSRKIAEDVGYVLRSTFGSWPVYPMENDLTLPLKEIMTRLMKRPADGPYPWSPLVHSNAAKLVSAISKGGEITLKDEEIVVDNEPSSRIEELLGDNYQVNRCRYNFWSESPINQRGYMSLNIGAKGQFGGIKFSDAMMENSDTESALTDFWAFIFILSNQLERFLQALNDVSKHMEPERSVEVEDRSPDGAPADDDDEEYERDPLFDQALAHIAESGKVSISGVQRKFRIAYNRSARIIEQLEAAGHVSEPGENGSRTLLIDEDDML